MQCYYFFLLTIRYLMGLLFLIGLGAGGIHALFRVRHPGGVILLLLAVRIGWLWRNHVQQDIVRVAGQFRRAQLDPPEQDEGEE